MKIRFRVAAVVIAAVASYSSLTYGQSEVLVPAGQTSTRPAIRRFSGEITALDPANNTVRFTQTNIKSVRPVEVDVMVNANSCLEEADISLISLAVGKSVFFSSDFGSQREAATITSLKPLTLQMEGGTRKLAVMNIEGEGYTFTWDYPVQRAGQSLASPFICAAPGKVTFRVVNPTTYRYDIRDFATLILTIRQPLAGKANPMRFTADKATLILKRATDVRLTRSTPLKISNLAVGQQYVVEAVVQPDETLAVNSFMTVYTPRVAQPENVTPADQAHDRGPSNPAGPVPSEIPRRGE